MCVILSNVIKKLYPGSKKKFDGTTELEANFIVCLGENWQLKYYYVINYA